MSAWFWTAEQVQQEGAGQIPVEAVEAAAQSFPGYTPEDEADDLERETNATCRAEAKRILEAAAPLIMERAWAEGWTAGDADACRSQQSKDSSGYPLDSEDMTANPYRRTP